MSVGAADSRPARMVQQAASPIYNQKSRLITYHIQWCNWKHRRQSHIRSLKTRAESAFHQSRLKKTNTGVGVEKHPLQLQIRTVERDDEIDAVAWLRAKSFYAYPEERKFAGEIHQMMIAEEESKALRALRLDRKLQRNSTSNQSTDTTESIIALCDPSMLFSDIDNCLKISDDGDTWQAAVGTLDIHYTRALPGEVLIASCTNAAYLANVCTAQAARRRGVGEAMVEEARKIARSWGAQALLVHTMAVNEIALDFYQRNGFIIEKEETSNQAHYRGRCLDGIEGRGRTVLLCDSKLGVM